MKNVGFSKKSSKRTKWMIPKCSPENQEAAAASLCITAQIKGRSKRSWILWINFKETRRRGLGTKNLNLSTFTSFAFGVFLTYFGLTLVIPTLSIINCIAITKKIEVKHSLFWNLSESRSLENWIYMVVPST